MDENETDQQLTSRIGTRFYRAPEVILCDPDYSFGVDIWAVGCVLGELLLNFIETEDESDSGMDTTQTKKKPFNPQDTYLFPGNSCYPISPCKKEIEESNSQELFISSSDQLIKILGLIGTPDERNDLAFLKSEVKKTYVEKLISKY